MYVNESKAYMYMYMYMYIHPRCFEWKHLELPWMGHQVSRCSTN